jgi:nucleoside-diphosphate-sugar epimerase
MRPDEESRVLAVTGASGLLGTHFCDHFRRRGWQVRALQRRASDYPFSEPGIQVHGCDLPDVLDEAALRGASVVVHCAYTTRPTDPEETRRVNEDGTLRVLAATRAAGARFVFVSSIAAHPAAMSYYGRSKHALEQRLDPARDLILRPGLVLAREGGLIGRLSATVRRTRVVPIFGDGRQRLQTVHVDDLCLGLEQALSLGMAGVLTVAEPDGIPYRELLGLLADRTGRRCVTVRVPVAPALAGLRAAERAGIRLPVSSDSLLGLTRLRHVDTGSDLRRLGIRLRPARESLAALASGLPGHAGPAHHDDARPQEQGN